MRPAVARSCARRIARRLAPPSTDRKIRRLRSPAMPARLHLFGSPTIDLDGGPVALPFERRSQLLVYLALKRAWVGRAELAAIFWPEQSQKLAFANLRKTLFRLQSVPWGRPIELQGQTARLECRPTSPSSRRRCATAASTTPCLSTPATCSPASTTPAAKPGPAGSASSATGCAPPGAARSCNVPPARSMPTEAVALTGRLLEADPLDEAALRLHLQALAQSGQGGRARQAYRAFVARLQDDLGLPPGAELQALHDSLVGARRTRRVRRRRRRRRGRRRRLRRSLDRTTAHRRDARPRRLPPDQPGRAGRRRQDAPRPPPDGRALARLQRRCRLRRPRRCGDAGGARQPAGARGRGRAGRPVRSVRAGDRVAARPAAPARARQLRAARRRRAADRDADRPLPAAARAGHDPGAPRHRFRVDLSARRPAPAGGRRRRPPRGLRRGAAVRARRAPGRADASSPTPSRRRWSTSAARSAACRSRSSWRPRGPGCCRARRSPPSCARAASCCAPSTRRGRRARPASRSSSTTPGSCSARPSARRWRGSRCSAAASRPRRRARSRRRCRCSAPCSTSRCCARRRAASSSIRCCSAWPPTGSTDGAARAEAETAHAQFFHRLLAQMRRPVDDGDREALQHARHRVRQRPGRLAARPRPTRSRRSSSPAAPGRCCTTATTAAASPKASRS